MHTPVTQFYYIKVGFKGVKIIDICFRLVNPVYYDWRLLTHIISQVDSSITTLWIGPFPIAGCLVIFYYYYVLKKFLFNANSVDPDQTLHSGASDLGLYCLLKSHLW